ncbi:MAG: MarR family transcriptional regulator, partial [Bacteroidota bacterium]
MPSSILQELKQTRPFASRTREAVVALLRTAVVVRRRTETAVQRVGLTLQQFNVLRILRGADAPLPTMEVADRMVEPE